MKFLTAAKSLDMDTWVRGVLSAAISGGASAISGGSLVSMLEPQTFNVQERKFYILVGGLFVANAVVSIAKFLQVHPLPDIATVTTTVKTTAPGPEPNAVTTTTVQEVHQEERKQ